MEQTNPTTCCSTKNCPIENTLKYIGKKWAINIIRDLFSGKKRFKDFLITNKEISTRVLSERLRDLEEHGIISKTVVQISPILIEYDLSRKGKALNEILCQLALFSLKEFPEEVLMHPKKDSAKAKTMAKKMFASA